MLQLYIKYKVSSIFNKASLYPIFCHFPFCKRTCVSDTVFRRICSRVYPNCLIDECGLFDEILIDDCFSDTSKAFFLPKYHMYLDVVYPCYKYIDKDKSNFFGYMHHESRKSSRQVFISFLKVFVGIYLNNVVLIFNELESHPENLYKKLYCFRNKGNRFAYDLLISFCTCVNLELFENIYKNIVPVKDYDSRCFKAVNEHYLKYLNAREIYYLKHRREKDFDEKKFDLIWLDQSKLKFY